MTDIALAAVAIANVAAVAWAADTPDRGGPAVTACCPCCPHMWGVNVCPHYGQHTAPCPKHSADEEDQP